MLPVPELDEVILMGPFQLGSFYDSAILKEQLEYIVFANLFFLKRGHFGRHFYPPAETAEAFSNVEGEHGDFFLLCPFPPHINIHFAISDSVVCKPCWCCHLRKSCTARTSSTMLLISHSC